MPPKNLLSASTKIFEAFIQRNITMENLLLSLAENPQPQDHKNVNLGPFFDAQSLL